MKKLKSKIVGHKIKKVIYSEINNPKRAFYFDGFDTFDYAVNIQMKTGYWWNLSWKDQEYFEFGEGEYYHNQYLNPNKIKSWDSTQRWKNVLNKTVTNFSIKFIDDAQLIPAEIEIEFNNEKKVIILIAEELNKNGSIPLPLRYEFNGNIYVFHNQGILDKIKSYG